MLVSASPRPIPAAGPLAAALLDSVCCWRGGYGRRLKSADAEQRKYRQSCPRPAGGGHHQPPEWVRGLEARLSGQGDVKRAAAGPLGLESAEKRPRVS